LGSLRVENGTNLDAAAVLIDDITEAPRRAFHTGSDWLAQRRFCQPHYTSEFEMVFDFGQLESEGGTEYKYYKVTLPVPLGTTFPITGLGYLGVLESKSEG
jgi:hypothetical protein